MLDQLSSAPFLPFSISGGVMLGLLLLELLFALVGKPLSALLDHVAGHGADIDHGADHAHGPVHGKFGNALAWLNAGRVPGLILLILALAWFSAAGFAVQGIADAIAKPLPAWVASVAALLLAAVPLRVTSRAVSYIIPRDETYVSTHGDLVGMTGMVTMGPVRKGMAAKARFRDQHGNVHFPRIEPFRDEDVIEEGVAVLAVEARGTTIAVTRAKPSLTGRIE